MKEKTKKMLKIKTGLQAGQVEAMPEWLAQFWCGQGDQAACAIVNQLGGAPELE